jgi:RHS repeat-associated protein
LLTQANKNNLLYTSREFDFETGLQFNRMRYYSPNLGRFNQKDLIYNNNANYYFYVQNNPENALDPFGLYNPGGIIPGIGIFDGDSGAYICCSGLPDPHNDPAARCGRCQNCCARLYPELQWWCYTMNCVARGCCDV